jgi:hypothetical protein
MGLAVKGDVPQQAVAGVGRREPTCGGIRLRPVPTAVSQETGREAVFARTRPIGSDEADRSRRIR